MASVAVKAGVTFWIDATILITYCWIGALGQTELTLEGTFILIVKTLPMVRLQLYFWSHTFTINFLTLIKHILNLKYVLNSRHTRMILKTVGNWEILRRQIFGSRGLRRRGKATETTANTSCAKFCRPCWSQTTPSRHSWRRPHLPPSTSSWPCLISLKPWNQSSLK